MNDTLSSLPDFDRFQLLGISLRYKASTGSTNDDAIQWLEEGAPDYAAVTADEQTHGRGRFQRKWVTNPGAALAVSVILHPVGEEMQRLALFSPLAGIALSSAVEELYGISPQIKWPNDVLLHEKKVCGILTETHWVGSELKGVVIGSGVNVTPAALPPQETLTFPAGCLEAELARKVERWDLLAAYLEKLIHWRRHLGDDAFMDFWQKHLAFVDREVEIRGNLGVQISGRLKGIDPNGELLIQGDAQLHTVQVGDVHLRLRAS